MVVGSVHMLSIWIHLPTLSLVLKKREGDGRTFGQHELHLTFWGKGRVTVDRATLQLRIGAKFSIFSLLNLMGGVFKLC